MLGIDDRTMNAGNNKAPRESHFARRVGIRIPSATRSARPHAETHMSHRHALLLVISAVCTLTAPSASAQSGLRFDPETGRDLANWLPPRDFDHTHMLLELDFPDFESRAEAICRCTIAMTAIGRPREEVRLDAEGMHVDRVTLGGRSLTFVHEGTELRVELPRVAEVGDEISLTIDYALGPDQMAPDGEALSWSPPTRRPSDPSEEVPMLHSQGQPEYAKRWFPCFDHPNERLATELIVTVHDGFEVVSNGVLVSREPQPDERVRWQWDQELPHAPYLVSLVIGRFDVVELGGPESARPDLSMPVYGPVGTADQIRAGFANTPAMIAYFERLFDEPYPWAKYSQAIVRDFAAGAMENTSATTFFPFAAAAPEGSLDDIIAHELVHQWTGDLVTCKNWAHLWLQEGWATFGESLWEEHQAERGALDEGRTPEEARAAGRRAYLRAIRSSFRGARAAAGTRAPDDPALASNLYADPNDTFMKANNPYGRGACVLHMLRERLGEEAFWGGVRLYIDRHKFSAVETDDFRRCLEEVSGDSLERFFAQWVSRAGLARADVQLHWEPASDDADGPGVLTVIFRQVQEIDEFNPAYAMVVPVYVKFGSGGGEYLYIETEEREAVQTFVLDERPSDAVIDPYLWNLLDATITRGLEAPAEEPAEEAEPVGAAGGS